MTAIVHLVMKHPEVHQRLVEVLEHEVVVGDEKHISYDLVKDIQYLDAVINEGCVFVFLYSRAGISTDIFPHAFSLRIYATTAIGLHREVPSGGAWCSGRYFPEGVSAYHFYELCSMADESLF